MTTRNWTIHPVLATGIAINAAVLAVAFALARTNPGALNRFLVEDGLVEWLQFLCFVVISGLLGFAALERSRRGPRMSLEVLGLIGLSLLVALAAMEEVSWFQRVLGVESPDFFRQNNRQSETNLHNLAFGGASLHKLVLLKLIFVAGITHNLILPLLARKRPGIRRFVESLGLYLPPLTASVAYLVLVLLSHLLVSHPRQGELGELFGAMHYLATVFTAYYVGVAYERPALLEHDVERRRVGTLFVMLMLFLVFVAWLLAAFCTRAIV